MMFIFWGNALGFLVAAAFFAKRYRRLRVETAMEVIRIRFGGVSEQVFTWLSFPITLIACAIWMNGLAAFFSALTMFFLFDLRWFTSLPLSEREVKELTVVATLIAHIVFTGGFFLLTRVFFSQEPQHIQQQRAALAEQLATPIREEEQAPINHLQGIYVGSITGVAGLGLIVIGFFLEADAQWPFFTTGGLVIAFSALLMVRRSQKNVT